MEKILSIIVPCYNSQDYLEKCVKSLVAIKSDVEILLIDDGSKDSTPQMIDQFAKQYPDLIIPIHQKNAGHGGALNTGFDHASGDYIKVVDSDDWVDLTAYHKIVDFLKGLKAKKQTVDLLISNYVYDKVGAKHKKVIHFPHLPKKKFFGWDDVKLYLGQYLMMHSLIYRREVITQRAHLRLPEHVSYDDNLYVFEPLQFVRKMYYLDVDFYHYFIGREDQSVNESVMLKKIDQQLLINKRMIKFYSEHIDSETSLGKYMKFYLEIITAISSIILIRGEQAEYLDKKDELWNYLKIKSPKVYKSLRKRPLGLCMHLPGKVGRKAASGLYGIARLIYGFN
ncbi:glycosyltransferase family 2 protein [Lactobacillus psittaci]|uniref:glycosyltransferase family 2 protein n=1 Tax=Lactobacillus psittaci TaxID=116089 RepID=UPI00040D4E13|nr:glycosyltransferase family 2 protein [Lactobacillus psittaci]